MIPTTNSGRLRLSLGRALGPCREPAVRQSDWSAHPCRTPPCTDRLHVSVTRVRIEARRADHPDSPTPNPKRPHRRRSHVETTLDTAGLLIEGTETVTDSNPRSREMITSGSFPWTDASRWKGMNDPEVMSSTRSQATISSSTARLSRRLGKLSHSSGGYRLRSKALPIR